MYVISMMDIYIYISIYIYIFIYLYIYIFMPVLHCSVVIHLKWRSILFWIILAIKGFLHSHINFIIISLPISAKKKKKKKVYLILVGIELNPYINLGSATTLIIIGLPIHKHGISFHSFKSLLISFNDIL